MPDAKAGYLRRLEKVRDCSTNLLERCEMDTRSATIFDLSAAHCAQLGTNPSSAASFLLSCCGTLTMCEPLYAQEAIDRTKEIVVSPEVKDWLKEIYVWDGHNDLPWALRDNAQPVKTIDLRASQPKYHTDIPRLRSGGVGAQFWSVYVPANTRKVGESFQTTMEQIQIVHDLVKEFPDTFAFCGSSDEVLAARKEGKIASLVGMEGGHSIENSLEKLRKLYSLGARYMTLTHSDTLEWADAATDTPQHQGHLEKRLFAK
jgi:Membrane dipeptidase (Peptidase family M19)